MTASKDMSRPTSQRRPSVSSTPMSLPVRNSYSRSHSHTASNGSLGSQHRINRRKSSTFTQAANAAVIGAAVEHAVADGSASINRRSSMSKAALGALNDDGRPPVPSSLPQHVNAAVHPGSDSAVVDGPSLSSFQGVDKSKNRARRASDGTHLSKKEKAATGDLKCEHCGKAYKHGSCLNKHLWEHTDEWQYTSKLLISKHQQVQLLEAASVLMGMGKDGPPTNDSDNSSSPAASGSSERDDGLSSTETTPPPQADRESKRFSNTSSAYSRSYQSVFSSGSMPADYNFGHNRHWSSSSNNRPLTANTSIAESYTDQAPEDMTAAMNLLSCSYGTPKSGPVAGGGDDIPPVPPLPEKYANAFSSYRGREDVVMDEEEEEDSSDDDHHRRPQTQHDDHEGFFGRMDA